MKQNAESYQSLGKRIVEVSRITGEFQLRSGTTSTVYFDKYRFEADPDLLRAIAEQMAMLVPDGTERVIGLEMGGIPLATALSLHMNVKLGLCRKEAKEYGTLLQIEGGIEKGEKVTIVEDVITTGGAAIEAVKVLRETGCEILALLCVLDREAGARDNFEQLGVDFRPLFTWSKLDAL